MLLHKSRRQAVQLLVLAALGYMSVRLVMSTMTFVGDTTAGGELLPAGGIDAASYVRENAAEMPMVPFDASRPKKVVVMTYQRCGSSFFGELFNTNPSAFYMYEPLDALYSALYGIREGWNVPSDITTFLNGSERVLPEREIRAVSVYLHHLLSCEMDDLPTEAVIHKFWFQFSGFHKSLSSYIDCLKKKQLRYSRCQSFTPNICGMRFGSVKPQRMEECNRYLWADKIKKGNSEDIVARNISLYRDCMSNMREEANEQCTPLFEKSCKSKSLRTAKTVRGTMASMRHLLKADDNIRVIHLIRDPRAVVLSRIKNFDSSGRSKFAGGSMVRESVVYCRDVVRDVKVRRTLEKLYPGRIMTLIYDDVATRPMAYAEKIYQFINTTLPQSTRKWLVTNTSKKKNSTQIAEKWMDAMSYMVVKKISEECEDFFRYVTYDFPKDKYQLRR